MPSVSRRVSSSLAHSLLYVMQAAPLGSLISSARIRASLIVTVFVFPLPGPARSATCPLDSYTSHWPGLSLRLLAARRYSFELDTGDHEVDRRGDILRRLGLAEPDHKALCETTLADVVKHGEE